MVVQSGNHRYAFGFGIYESTDSSNAGCNAPCVESTFTITLWNNGAPLSPSYLLSPANNVVVFWGLQTDFAFDAIRIRETTGGIDNEIFGTFYSGALSVPVPEPGSRSLWLAGLALAGLGYARRRWRRGSGARARPPHRRPLRIGRHQLALTRGHTTLSLQRWPRWSDGHASNLAAPSWRRFNRRVPTAG